MAMSDRIEAFITELLKDEAENGLEIGRNELAGIFNCVPSQINYVISTRFCPEKGYIVESRRGGGGYIRIKRVAKEPFEFSKKLLESTKKSISAEKAEAMLSYLSEVGKLSEREREIAAAAVSADIIGKHKEADKIRAGILKNILERIL